MPTWRTRVCSPASPQRVLWLSDAVVRVENGQIAEVAPYDGRPVDEDLRPGVLLPGFVDTHLHAPQTRIVGSASGPLLEWLQQSTFPEEARFADPDHARAVSERFCTRLASAGTTLCLAYGSVHPEAADQLLAALDRRGLRAIAGPVLMDEHAPAELCLAPDRALPALVDLVDRWHGHDRDRLRVAVIPRFALSCSRAMLRGAARIAADRSLFVSTHLAETEAECRIATERFGTADYLEIYEAAGLIGPRTVLAHCIHLSSGAWDRLADAGAVVAHCPDSNDFLGSGSMPLPAVIDRGIPLGIGSDIAAGRSFRIPRILSSAHDNALRQHARVDPARLLWWGHAGGGPGPRGTRRRRGGRGPRGGSVSVRPPTLGTGPRSGTLLPDLRSRRPPDAPYLGTRSRGVGGSMSASERENWDRRYSEPGFLMGDGPKRFVVDLADLLPKTGTVLDLGCGEGQNLIWLASQGLSGTGVDISAVALAKAGALSEAMEVPLELIEADLDEWDPEDRKWNVVLCSHLLIRDLVPRIRRATAPGGIVLMENMMYGAPISLKYLAESQEMLRWFLGFRVLHYRELTRDGVPVAQIAARRPG